MLRNHQQTQIGYTSRFETILCVNVAFFYNNFDQFLPIVMTFTAGCSPVATSFECEDVRMCPFANLICDS